MTLKLCASDDSFTCARWQLNLFLCLGVYYKKCFWAVINISFMYSNKTKFYLFIVTGTRLQISLTALLYRSYYTVPKGMNNFHTRREEARNYKIPLTGFESATLRMVYGRSTTTLYVEYIQMDCPGPDRCGYFSLL